MTSAFLRTTLLLALLIVGRPVGAAESLWIEAEHLDGIKGYCWPMGTPEQKKTGGHWALSGPGWAAEWTQGGESGFLSIEAAFAGLALAGVGLAPVFPCLMTRTPQRLGASASAHAIGFQVGAAMLGAAAVPAVLGLIAGERGLETILIATVVVAVVLWLLHAGLTRWTAPAEQAQ